VRVIAGTHRGRRLPSPPPGVRPTSDRVRESIFSRLGDPVDARVLDLFAGSGALGIESLSRGAESVVFVDQSRKVAQALERTLESLNLEASVLRLDARGALRRLGEQGARFDLVFIDPPYAADQYARVLPELVANDLLESEATVVVESAKRHSLAPVAGLVIESERTYGDSVVRWLARDGESPDGDGREMKGNGFTR
jgi:16S rRNA (guanine966-N2)-methyltransferase